MTLGTQTFRIALLGLAVAVYAQDELTIRVGVRNVLLDVRVLDPNGVPVPDLKADDFSVYDNEQPQQVTHFESIQTPLDVLFAVDRAALQRKPNLSSEQALSLRQVSFLEEAIPDFLRGLRPGDKISVLEFGPEPGGSGHRVASNWQDRESMLLSIPTLKRTLALPESNWAFEKKIPLYSAVTQSLDMFRLRGGKKAIVVFVSGLPPSLPELGRLPIPSREVVVAGMRFRRMEDPAEDAPFQDLLMAVSRSGVRIHVVAIDTDKNFGFGDFSWAPLPTIVNQQQLRARMELLARASSGSIRYPTSGSLGGLYGQMAEDLVSSYTLGFYRSAPPDGARHIIKVTVRDPALRVVQSQNSYDDSP